MDDDSSQLLRPSLTDILYVIFLRIVALSCLWFGLTYWGMLVGYSDGGFGRFDLLSLPWRAAATSLAVIFPVAALGLWLASSWGPVIWTIAAGLQLAMFVVWTQTFGDHRIVVISHILVAAVYVTFRAAIWFQGRQRAEPYKI
ncbi:DUF6163 family protein [Rhizobium halophytocola]|uniref:Transmembrane protein n=1 Tax=Rhizobium halophytocola TaxID=735519 RepID=A0ABS4DYD7_9HYPH|nr:DUF6163 family protein [Rhizobium halophytocola]MBP1850691.1 hypothetical protein [Rhizobium halophytocola]